jgi:AbrB family looped-hinge helix DNA binding protein
VGGPFIVCDSLVKIYRIGETEVLALQGLELSVGKGELLGIIGASGSGKTTLMNILGGLDRPTAGKAFVDAQNLLSMTDRELDRYRRSEVGFVWQQSSRNLIPYLTALENVELPMMLAGVPAAEKRRRARELLAAVGLVERAGHTLVELSGGEQQRVAIAVALANNPTLLLADEPTGSLDSANAQDLLQVFRRLNEQYQLTTLIVTHDLQLAKSVERVITIRDGKTSTERIRYRPSAEAQLPPVGEHFREYVVLDSAGRLQIPPEFREELDIGDRVELERVEGGILIRPVESASLGSQKRKQADSEAGPEPGGEEPGESAGGGGRPRGKLRRRRRSSE